MHVVWTVLGGETTPCFQEGCCMKVWAMSQFCYQAEVQPRVQPFSALMLCCASNMRMRQVKMHFLQPLTPLDASHEWITLFVQSVDCSDRKCFQERLLFSSFFKGLFSVVFIDLGAFLTRMRDYMPPAHRQLIETLCSLPSLRDFLLCCSSSDLCQAYNSCVSALVDLRSYHLNTVTKYIIVPGNHAMGCPLRGVCTGLNATGTGGTSLMVFLKSVRNATQKALILERPSVSRNWNVIYSIYYNTFFALHSWCYIYERFAKKKENKKSINKYYHHCICCGYSLIRGTLGMIVMHDWISLRVSQNYEVIKITRKSIFDLLSQTKTKLLTHCFSFLGSIRLPYQTACNN